MESLTVQPEAGGRDTALIPRCVGGTLSGRVENDNPPVTLPCEGCRRVGGVLQQPEALVWALSVRASLSVILQRVEHLSRG